MKNLLAIISIFIAANAQAQPPAYDSIAFHLYTDSLKRYVHNYINVDGRLTSGGWLPLTDRQLQFQCPQGRFEGNSLIIDSNFQGKSVDITVTDKRNKMLTLTRTVYIKQAPDNERLKTTEEVLGTPSPKRRRRS